MLTQADIDAAVSESLARTQELVAEYGEHFVRPLEEVQMKMRNAQFTTPALQQAQRGASVNKTGGNDGQRKIDQAVSAGHEEQTPDGDARNTTG